MRGVGDGFGDDAIKTVQSVASGCTREKESQGVRPNDGAGWRSRAARAGAWLGVACALALALAAGPFASAAAAQGGGLPLQTFATGTGTPSLPTGWTQSTVDTGVTETWHVQPSPQTV